MPCTWVPSFPDPRGNTVCPGKIIPVLLSALEIAMREVTIAMLFVAGRSDPGDGDRHETGDGAITVYCNAARRRPDQTNFLKASCFRI